MKSSKKHIEAVDAAPDKSKLEISIEQMEGKPADFRFAGKILDSGGTTTPLKKSDVFPGPFKHKLRSPRVYIAEMAVGFNAQAKVKLIARVVHPDGTEDPQSMSWTLSGSTGVEIRRLIVRCA